MRYPLFISRMAEEQKTTVEVPEVPKQETTPLTAVTDAVATEAAPVPETAPVTEAAPVEESAPVDATVEDNKDEVKPVEEGHLSHKAQGASFPKSVCTIRLKLALHRDKLHLS